MARPRGPKREQICAQRAFVGSAVGPKGAPRFPRSDPMNSTVRETLAAIRQQAEGDQVFPINDVKRSFSYACVKAKIADFHFHDLRHTAATRLTDRGADAFQIAAILGHSSIQMTARYTHATSDGLRRVMESLAMNDKQVGKISPTIPPQFAADGREANAQIANK
jgi:hypothetical protein